MSAEVVRLIRKEFHREGSQSENPLGAHLASDNQAAVNGGADATKKRRSDVTMGMFKHFEAPSLEEFVELRRASSKTLTRATRRRAKHI